MKSFLQKRVLSPSLFFLAVGALIHCGGNDGPSFSTQGDTAVMSGIVGTWMGTSNAGNTYTLTLCENKSNDLTTDESCATLHTVRGDGRGKTETVSEPGGCGGCDYDNSAYVTGTVEGDDLAPTDIAGQFELLSGDANGLGFPYKIDIGGSGAARNTFSIGAAMQAAGSFQVDSFYYAPTTTPDLDGGDQDAGNTDAVDADAGNTIASGIVFHRVGDAACP